MFYGFEGMRERLPLALGPVEGGLSLSVQRTVSPARLLVHDAAGGRLLTLQGKERQVLQGSGLQGAGGVFVDAAGNRVAALEDPVRSALRVLDKEGAVAEVRDVGRFENLFWVVVPPRSVIGQEPGEGMHPGNPYLAALEEGRYVKFCAYGHYRADAASPGYRNPDFGNDDPEWWAGTPNYPALIRRHRPSVMWEPCFTHRGFGRLLGEWAAVRDETTGLPKYMMTGRLGTAGSYVEAVGKKKSGFALTTYAFGLPNLDHVYLDHLSKLLTGLATYSRRSPERFPSLEPNHENEIPMKVQFTVGDYNPKMVEGFFRYLVCRYGDDPAHLNDVLGTDFEAYFDAPRWQDRGAWDEYGKHNRFFREWVLYNRYVVSRRLAQATREALLAGFPPEFIKYHQIPDTYISGGNLGFSKVQNRITPLDWAISCGTGYGWTRYGVWYRNRHNVVQGGWSSGQDAVLVGEYNSLTRSTEEAVAQLEYMYDHGVMGVHVMGWQNDDFQRTSAEAVVNLIDQDRPRPGLAGGVGQLYAVRDGDRRFDIASLGAGARHTGLLKSLKADGSWEGSVYAVPFKAHVDVEPLAAPERMVLRAGEPLTTDEQPRVLAGTQFEVSCGLRAAGRRTDAGGGLSAAAQIEISVCHGGRPLPGLTAVVSAGETSRRFRWVHRVPLPTQGLALRLRAVGADVELDDLTITRQTARIADIAHGVPEGKRHRGGITFDLLD